MDVHTRRAYRWDGVDPDAVRQDAQNLDHLLRMARERNAAAYGSADPSHEAWPRGSGSDLVWRPHFDEGANAHDLSRSEKVFRRGNWLIRSLKALLLLMMAGVACLPFGADVVKIVTAVL